MRYFRSYFIRKLTGKGFVRAGSGRRTLNSTWYRPLSSASHENKKGKGILTADCGNKKEWDF